MSWWTLRDIIEHARIEFDTWWSQEPMACPNDGEPLRRAPPGGFASTGDASATGKADPNGANTSLYCPFCFWCYPRDFVRPPRMW